MRVDASWCELAVKRKRDLQLASSFDRGFTYRVSNNLYISLVGKHASLQAEI